MAGQVTPSIFVEPAVSFCIHKSPPWVPILTQLNLDYTLNAVSLWSIFPTVQVPKSSLPFSLFPLPQQLFVDYCALKIMLTPNTECPLRTQLLPAFKQDVVTYRRKEKVLKCKKQVSSPLDKAIALNVTS
jgi:hypothetical protein